MWPLFLLAIPTGAMRGSRSATVSPGTVAEFFSFDFAVSEPSSPGNFSAWLSLTGGASDAKLWGLLCTDGELDTLLSSFDSASALCAADLTGLCSDSSSLSLNSSSWDPALRVERTCSVHFIFAACSASPVNMDVAGGWHTTNPNGEELPAGEIPLKQLTTGFGSAWAALGGAFFLSMACVRAASVPPSPSDLLALEDAQLASPIRPIHWALLAPPALLAAEGFLGAARWRAVSARGEEDWPLALSDAGAWDLGSVALIAVVVALARGWQVTRLRLGAVEWRVCGSLLLLYLFAWLYWSFLASFISLFLLFVSYAMLLRFTFNASSFSLRLLQLFSSFSASLHPAPAPADAGAAQGGTRAPSLWQRARGALGLGPAAGTRDYAVVNGEEDAPPPPPPALVDGGLSERQIRFLTAFRWGAAAYITAVRFCAPPLPPFLPSHTYTANAHGAH